MANLVQTKKPLSITPLLAFTTIFLLLFKRVHSSDSLSFTFNTFTPDQRDIILQGDAKLLSTNTLQLTGQTKNTVGRALYSAPVHLWEKSTNKVASFQSSFTFLLTSRHSPASDGITFFIAPTDTTIPHGSSGGYLGLFSPENALNTSANQVVAVEFDTFPDNNWDPSYIHIGIDVNSIRSAAVTKWNRRQVIVLVDITYEAVSGNLSVVSSYHDRGQDYSVL